MKRKPLFLIGLAGALSLFGPPLLAQQAAGSGVDPLAARVDMSAVERFAAVWKESNGTPSEEQIQASYLKAGDRGIEVFTPNRIGSAKRLAGKIAANPQLYRDAIERCMPWVERTNMQLRATYLGFKGLWPNRELPKIAMVIGANNSGGTAAEGIQVLGLEVLCRLAPNEAAFEDLMRQFFAHETVHTFQRGPGEMAARTPLLFQAFNEGVPDYVTKLLTGRIPNPERDQWARAREAQVWRDFQADAAIVKTGTDASGKMNTQAEAAFRRWFGNAGDPPEGWPDELGYWVGMRIAETYVAKAADPRAAIEQLLNPAAPEAILRESGYGGEPTAKKGEKFTR